ncbi:MAG: pentapeptide repeat-containing protein [Anaerolineae bacterium]|nr:pentapeptide repeat-containing protein [Anaerolineae bacterium]
MKHLRAIVGIFLLISGVLTGFLHSYPETWQYADVIKDYYANASTELVSIALTVLLIDALYEYRQNLQLKEQLIREMRSPDNGIALRAVEELRAYNWLFDGSLKGVSLRKANLAGCNLKGAVLDSADFTGANLKNASFRDASMETAILSGANLEGAFLRGAKLHQAIISGAILKNAILISADLEATDFSGAIFNRATQFPEGFNPRSAQAIFRNE